MDGEAALNALEHMLEDESAEPMNLPFSLLEDITNCFSDDWQLGSGGFAVVYKGVVGDGMVAVKKLTNTFNLEETRFHKEVECLLKAKHRNIVRFLGYCAETQGQIADYEGKFVMSDKRNWLLCFEYVPNGSLDRYIADASHGLEWVKRFAIIKGICEGLCSLHDKRILHLDLKPANILIADHGVPKLADFGLSRCINEEQTRILTSNLCGSVGYLAPEFFRGQVGFTSDIYSLGVIIVEILTGEKGYPDDESVVESWMNRLEGDMQLEQVRVCTKIGIECMDSDPKKRPAARHIIARLDKTSSIEETSSTSSLLTEQECQESIGNTFAAQREDAAQCLAAQKEDVKGDQLSVWGSPDIKQYQRDTSISSSNSGVFRKLSNLDIFNRKAHRNFTRNGGPIIQQSNSVMIFLKEDMKEIFKTRNLIARGAFGDVYTGNLSNRQVTVRKPIAGSLLHNEDFANQVIKRSQVIHKNIIRLIGCCLEVDIPILVYEFVYNGRSLRNILENGNKVPLNLGARLHIAAQAADGLAYTHSETHNRILIWGLEAANIVLDENFMPKISDFGISGAHLVEDITAGDYWIGRPKNQEESSYDFIGLPASDNKNPLFKEENQWTQQSDVYSFGIIILELISGKDTTNDENNSLVKNFLKCHKKGKKATELFDKEIAITRDLKILDTLAEIAVECLSSIVDARPRMIEVASRLLRISG